jgi:polyribonucleotide nucleotidyltransferase
VPVVYAFVCVQGGKTIKGITAASGVTAIETNNNGTVQIVGSSEAAITAAKEMINLMLDQLPPGVGKGVGGRGYDIGGGWGGIAVQCIRVRQLAWVRCCNWQLTVDRILAVMVYGCSSC